MRQPTTSTCLALAALVAGIAASQTAPSSKGIFSSDSGVGTTPKPGKVEVDLAKGEYRVTGGGANIWGTEDAFHFAFNRLSGDVTLTADVSFVGAGVDPHRKAVLMIRQDLTAGSAYADIAVHGDGLTSLQYRRTAGGPTEEIRSTLSAPKRIRIERRGNTFTVFAGNDSQSLVPAGPQTIELTDPVYVGIGVSAHNVDVLETAVFSNVQLEQSRPSVSTSK